MTAIAYSTRTVAARFDTMFSATIAHCAAFCAGARQGREIEVRYHDLARKSASDLARLGLTRSDIARVAVTGRRH